MRLQNLQLVRYGKFTETEIALPRSQHDFHLIVGPNEAGKSTIRGAIADLLFGFPVRANAMAFLHPQPELRLAAQIANDDAVLDFARVKAAKNTLRNAADTALADDALAEFLGAADRKFFENMFGLGHMQLVEGGQSILDASKDVSQVLFQSAAGIAGLGKVKEALVDEAGKLWGPRYSATRSYYAAHDQCEEASRELKAATVRTKAWADASKEFDEAEASIATAKAQKAQLQTRRGKLERVRRLAPAVQELRSAQADLQALGEVLDLPANASEILDTGESELSVAQTVLRHCSLDVQQFTQQREDAVYDAEMLALKSDVEDLAAFGERVRNHYADLLTQQAELERSVLLAQTAGAELGWPQEPAGLRSKLSLAVALREVQRLVAEHGALKTTTENAINAAAAKQEELDAVAAELEETVGSEVPVALRGVISEAQAIKNTAATQAKLASAVQTAQRNLEVALAGLGAWRRDIQALGSMSIPSAERLAGLLAKRHALEAEHAAGVGRTEDAQEEFESAELACKQYAEASRVVTGQDVRQARDSRDEKWHLIKTRQTGLESGAAGLEAAIALADELVDSQLGSATEAAELQSLRQRAERAKADLETRQRASERKAAELAALDQEWQVLSAGLQLPQLALADAQAWMARREQALQAAALLDEKHAQLQDEVKQAQAVTAALMAQLLQAGAQVIEGCGLPVMLAQAEALISATDQANARRMQLQKQGGAAKVTLARLQAASESAQTAYSEWQMRWSAAVETAALSDYVKTVADAEQAIMRVEQVRTNLDKADATQRDRIDTMNHDLAEFASRAKALVKVRGAVALEQADARQVVREFSQQLREAEAGFARCTTAEGALSSAQQKLTDAEKEVERINAKVQPLLAAAGVSTLAEARPLIERSNRKRQLAAQIAQTRELLAQGSDGLSLDAVMEEVQAFDVEQVAAELLEADDQLEQVQVSLTQLAEVRLRAEQAVQVIGGGNDAAAAEARRQEALAGMADASDRYIKVTTAAKLLTWAIDRYREQNQGPMLARAGAIFAGLTLGQYNKLFVDYAKTPLSLSARRANGNVVDVSGLSEGTRDQLYLALRLAALELHLAKSKALPFVADDLFINFDDERSTAGLEALRDLSTRTQVLFLSHHEHLLPRVQKVFGDSVNVVRMAR